jgi:hypothetical protein
MQVKKRLALFSVFGPFLFCLRHVQTIDLSHEIAEVGRSACPKAFTVYLSTDASEKASGTFFCGGSGQQKTPPQIAEAFFCCWVKN